MRVLAIIFAAFLAVPAYGQSCAPHAALSKALEDTGGRLIFAGKSIKGHSTEIWVNEVENEWAAFTVEQNGLACLVDSGIGILTVQPIGLKI